jgi:hypothetical protein
MKKNFLFLFVLIFCLGVTSFAEELGTKKQELGKIVIRISPFEYFYGDPYGIDEASQNRLGPVADYMVRIIPVTDKAKEFYSDIYKRSKMWGTPINILPCRPKDKEEAERALSMGSGSIELFFNPDPLGSGIYFELAVPVGKYFLDYQVNFKLDRYTYIPRYRYKNEDCWGPLEIFVSKDETIEVIVKPSYRNWLSPSITELEFIMEYAPEMINGD